MEGWKTWVKGLVSAAISAGSAAVALIIVDPMDYNLADPEAAKRLGVVCAVSAIIAIANYLKQSPLPGKK